MCVCGCVGMKRGLCGGFFLQDFGLDHVKFKALPDVINSKCPEEFMDLALMCCKVN